MRVTRQARRILKTLFAGLLQASGCFWWAKYQLRRQGAVTVLTFHRVLTDAEFRLTCSLPGMIIRNTTFAGLAAYVARKFQPVDLRLPAAATGGKLRVAFTFDDGWKDNHTNALPVLTRYRIPSTVFVCPGLVGRALPFWPERVGQLMKKATPPVSGTELETLIETLKGYSTERREKFIAQLQEFHTPVNSIDTYACDRTATWDDIREMDAAGMRAGCHTQTHQILTSLPAAAARQEVRQSKRALEAALYRRCDAFAYPNGNTSAETQRMLAEEGFTAAFTTEKGAWTRDRDCMRIPRINICESGVAGPAGRFSPALFQYTVFWKAWRVMRAGRRAPAKQSCQAVLSEA